ncbi:hypothetical protein Tco_1133862 [Tanacetum coccineum]
MQIPEWMLMEEMELSKHFQLYASAFGVDVSMTQSQPIESIQGTHKTPSTPRPPNHVEHQGESSTPRKPTVIRIRRRSQPNPETLIPTTAEIDISSLDEATQMSIATERSLADLEDHQEDPNNRLVSESHKERERVEKSANLMIIDGEEEEELAGDALIRRKGKGIVKIKDTPPTTPIRSPRTHSASLSSDNFDPTPSSSKPTTSSPKLMPDHVKRFKAIIEGIHATLKKVVPKMVDHKTNDFMKNNLPKAIAEAIQSERKKVQDDIAAMVADSVQKERQNIRAELSVQVTNDVANIVPSQMKDDESIWLSLKIKFERPIPLVEPCRVDVVRTRNHEDHHDDNARPGGESSAKIQNTSAHGTFKIDGQDTDDDEVPDEEVSPELLDEVSGNVMTSDELQRMQGALNSMDVIQVVYTEKKIVDVVRVQFDQGYGEEYMTEIVVKRADGGYSEFTESDYKYLHKNDTKDMYLMCINGIIKDYRQTGLLKVLEKVKNFNLDVKHSYADPDLRDEDAEYMRENLIDGKSISSESNGLVTQPGMLEGTVYHDLYNGGKDLVDRENMGFNLTKFNICPSFIEDLIAKGMSLRVADSHTEMAFRNFIYAKNEEDLSFLPKEPSLSFGTGSPSVLVNTEPPNVDAEPTLKLAEDTADFGGSPKPKVFVVHPGSVATQIKDRRCKTSGGSSRPPLKRKLAPGSSSSRATRAKTSSSKDDPPFLTVSDDDEGLLDVFELKDANACHLKIFAITPPAWKNHLDNVIKKIKGECDVMKERERAREEECEELRTKCEAAMTNFEKNLTVVAIQVKMSTLSTEAKEHKANLDRMMLESQKWAGYQVSLSALGSKVASLEVEKARLEVVKVSLRKEVDDIKRDMMERCAAFEKVADMKEPFDLPKVKVYRPSYKKEHTQAGNKIATATFPWLSEFTQVHVPSSQRATRASAPASNPMSPLVVVSSIKPQYS